MKAKRVMILFACILLAAFLLGAAGAASLADAAAGEKDRTADDRLIGVLVTTEYLDLFDTERYFNDHAGEIISGGEIREAERGAYEGRLYATCASAADPGGETAEAAGRQSYIFEGVEGIRYFVARYTDAAGSYYGASGDEAVADGHTAIHSTDAGDSVSLEGTVYVSTRGGPSAFYYNPVYQTAQGEVYAVSGSGMSYGGDVTAGMSGSHNLSEKTTVTKDGTTGEVGTEVQLSVCYVDPPVSVRVLQLDSVSRLLSRTAYVPGELPQSLTAEADAAYVIVETAAAGADGAETTTRELFQPTDEAFETLYCRADGICVKQSCSIVWNA